MQEVVLLKLRDVYPLDGIKTDSSRQEWHGECGEQLGSFGIGRVWDFGEFVAPLRDAAWSLESGILLLTKTKTLKSLTELKTQYEYEMKILN